MSTPLFRILPASYLAAWIRGVHPDMPTHLDQWTTVSLPGAPGSIIAPHPKNQFKLGNGEWRKTVFTWRPGQQDQMQIRIIPNWSRQWRMENGEAITRPG